MTDPSDRRETGDDNAMGYDGESSSGIPRWMKVTGIILAVLALLVVVVMLAVGGGGHGPRRHGSGDTGGRAPAGIAQIRPFEQLDPA
jgi:hypothetical protein